LIRLAQREFSNKDQERFAAVSGDRNPIHVDPLESRRTQAGAPVVHGIHLLLYALDSLAEAQPYLAPLRSLRAQFSRFVYLDESVCVDVAEQSATRARLFISVDGARRTKITLDFGDAVDDCDGLSATPLETVPFSLTPLNLDMESMQGYSGRLPFAMTPEDATTLFPAAAKWLGTRRIAALAASTYLVGMVCPGLYSIYNELSVHSCVESSPRGSLAFRVIETDPRYSLVEQEILGGGFAGKVKSFVRSRPVQQATMASLAGLVGPTDFAGSVALIVGGSRGLGELAAKMIATGGGQVIVTWNTGKTDAERVAHEIQSAGGKCEVFSYDAGKPAAEQLASLTCEPTHAYYFATPTIFRPQAEIFVAERFKELLSFYVDGFWELTQTLRARRPNLSVFYPSTVFVSERSKGMTEYAMAKSAGEVLCADMNRSQAPLHVTICRLPRLPTDQTASIKATETARPVETMLPVIREVQSWPK